MNMTAKEKCQICGRDWLEYDPSWKCRRYHNWQKGWRSDKNSKKYKEYLEKRKISMQNSARKRLELLDKKMPSKYKSRKE